MTKPDRDKFVFYLINLSQQKLDTQCLRPLAGTPRYVDDPNATSIKFPNASWSNDTVTLGYTIYDLETTVVHTVDTRNSTPGTYVYSVVGSTIGETFTVHKIALNTTYIWLIISRKQ